MANTKQDALDSLKQQIIHDKVCVGLAETATQLVFGEGSPDASIVFIGEAPGKNEDITGQPFVGAAGKFLNEMLETINLKREDIYITNIVKYRPPDNRDPLPDEKAAFLPYLIQQINIIKPKLIVTLGRHSMECFLPGLKIGQAHGQPKRIRIKDLAKGKMDGTELLGGSHVDALQGASEKWTEPYENTVKGVSQQATPQSATKLNGFAGSAGESDELLWVILPLFHPAAALYNGSLRQTLIDDFARIPAIIDKLNK